MRTGLQQVAAERALLTWEDDITKAEHGVVGAPHTRNQEVSREEDCEEKI